MIKDDKRFTFYIITAVPVLDYEHASGRTIESDRLPQPRLTG
jgi:hypothetical protein